MPAIELVPFIILFIFSFSDSFSPLEPFNYEAVLVQRLIFIEAGKSRRREDRGVPARMNTLQLNGSCSNSPRRALTYLFNLICG